MRTHHQTIKAALENFNAGYFSTKRILFGGGTRICLELDEFRESVDIDFLCPDINSYRAVRSVVAGYSLGLLVKKEFNYVREIRCDRYAVRTVIEIDHVRIKLEFISMDNYRLNADVMSGIQLPVIDHASCFTTKLLAHADRYGEPSKKDLIDLLAMKQAWGDIPLSDWEEAQRHYGDEPAIRLKAALVALNANPQLLLEINTKYKLQMSDTTLDGLLCTARAWNDQCSW